MRQGKKSSKIQAVILSMGVILGMLSGCSGKKETETSVKISTETETQTQSTETSEDTMPSETETKPSETETIPSEAPTEETTSSEKAPEEKAKEILQTMTLEEKIGQMMIASFSGTELTVEIRDSLSKNHFGGVMLGTGNFTDVEQTIRLVSEIQTENQKGSLIPLLISADQEGGTITRVHYGTSGVGNMALAATGDPECAKEMAEVYGEELQALGINTDFAPVLDVNNNPANPVIGVRSFSDDPKIVAEYGTAYIDGLRSKGVIPTLKHFPGHGDTNTDSHTGFPKIDKTYEELKDFELIPFKAAIEDGAEMIMTAHIQYPQIEKETYITPSGKEVYLPATMSRTILTDILRGDMGYDGVIVTDSLEMAAISENFTFEDALCKSINAGADMLLLPGVWDKNTLDKTNSAVGLVVQMVKDGRIPEEEIDDSVLRILILKEKHGIPEESAFAVSEEEILAAKEIVGCSAHKEKEQEIAKKSLTLVQNNSNAYPFSAGTGKETLILFSGSAASREGYGKQAAKMLPEENITVMTSSKENESDCLEAALRAENVILVSRVYGMGCLDPKKDAGYSTGVFDEIISARHEAGKTVIVISCQLPYDGSRFPEADAVILAYCSSYLKDVPPESGEGSAYPPNLLTAILACFSGGELTGKAPADLSP